MKLSSILSNPERHEHAQYVQVKENTISHSNTIAERKHKSIMSGPAKQYSGAAEAEVDDDDPDNDHNRWYCNICKVRVQFFVSMKAKH